MTTNIQRYHCPRCDRFYPVSSPIWQCCCGSPLDLQFQPEFPIQKILERPPTLWRYREAIPVAKNDPIVSIMEGFTPLEQVDINGHCVLLKVDYLFPTGSFKDRGATVLVTQLKALKIKKVVEDSSGNAGSAIAAYCAKGGMECEIFVPDATSPEKLVQIEAYGARLRKVEGSRERTAEAAMRAASKAYYASHCWNPFFFHGTKTFAFEVWEQMGWKVPDAVILPLGHGTLFLGAYIGFKELMEAGMVKRIPKLVGVQSASCAPLYQAFKKGQKEIGPIEKKETMAEGIAIANPVRGWQILEVVRETGGEILSVTEREVKVALNEMAKKGHFIEPTSAATIAGLKSYLRKVEKAEVVVSTLTGTGLKAKEKILHL